MRECFLITTYCDTKDKIIALNNCIDTLKQYNIDIMIIAHYPLNSDIQKKVNYLLYNSNNPILPRYNRLFHKLKNYNLEIRQYDYAYAVMKLWKEGIEFLKFKDYDMIHIVNYDVNIIPELYNLTKSKVEKYNKSIFYTNYSNLDLVQVINFTLLKNDFEYFLKNLNLQKFLEFTFPGFSPETLLPSIEQYLCSFLNDNFYRVPLEEWHEYVEMFLKNEMNISGYKNNQIKLSSGLYSQIGSSFLFLHKGSYSFFIGKLNKNYAILLFNITEKLKVEINVNNKMIQMETDLEQILIDLDVDKEIKIEIRINDELLEQKYIIDFFEMSSTIHLD